MLHKEKFPLLADALQAAAGVAGKQKWAHRDVSMYLREPTVEAGPDDEVSLRRSTTNPRGVYPPVAFAEVYCNDSVDLERAKSVASNVYWQFQKMNVSARYEECFNTLPVPMTDSDCPLRCFFLLQRCLGKSRAVRPSVSKAKGTTGMYNGPLNKLKGKLSNK